MSFNNLILDFQDSTAVVTLHRPGKRNALSLELMQELIELLGVLEKDLDVRCVILAAAGKAFCAGHDLGEMVGCAVGEYRQLFETCTELMEKIQSIPQPVIAEVQGVATAAGCQLVATCDLAIAAEEAAFATPGVRIGLFCSTPMVAISRVIGRKRAMQMLLTGQSINAETAAEWGLVNFVVPAAELREATLKLAKRIGEASSFTVGIGKQAFYSQIDLDQQRAYTLTKEVMTNNAVAADAQEGISAFLENVPQLGRAGSRSRPLLRWQCALGPASVFQSRGFCIFESCRSALSGTRPRNGYVPES
jgi:enoyl-CoA hydratase/carnithine racemase